MTQKLRTVIPAALNEIRQSSTLMSVMGYSNNYGELSNFSIAFHVDYLKAVEKALTVWRGIRPADPLERRVLEDLLESYESTLDGHNTRALSAHAYSPISDGRSLIKSVKWHDNDRAVHFWGFLVHKVILRPGTYPVDNKSEWAQCRQSFLAQTPIAKFRQFKIVEGRFKKIAVEHLRLTQEDLLRIGK